MQYDEYHNTHRMPRMLVVMTNVHLEEGKHYYSTATSLRLGLDCNCLKFFTMGAPNMHTLTPLEYEGDEMAIVEDAWQQAMHNYMPYDIIVADTIDSARKLAEWVKDKDPKPAVITFMRSVQPTQMVEWQKEDIYVFRGADMFAEDGQTAWYDMLVEHLLESKGVKRLECNSGRSAYEQWQGSDRSLKEIIPTGFARKQTGRDDSPAQLG